MNNMKKTYEGMFLLDAGKASFETGTEPIQNILSRSDAELLSIKPWDERRLAYEIKDCNRGLYVLTYFKADPSRVVEIEHDCQLSEQILRVLFLRRDNLTEEQINTNTPATDAIRVAEEAEAARAAKEAEIDKESVSPEDEEVPSVDILEVDLSEEDTEDESEASPQPVDESAEAQSDEESKDDETVEAQSDEESKDD